MMERIILPGTVLVSIQLLSFAGIRAKKLSPWTASGIVALASILVGMIIVRNMGDDLVGALCLSPLLAVSFGLPTLILGFALRRS